MPQHTNVGDRFDVGPLVRATTFAHRGYVLAITEDAVLDVIVNPTVPMVLAAASDLEPAYRAVNTHRGLLEQGIDANPSSLSLDGLESRGRVVLNEHYADELVAWREDFGSRKANGRASSQLSNVARAATAGQVDTLLFDLDSNDEGGIDEVGALTFADAAGPTTYGLLDEIAARVLRTGGTV